ncbi:hypothetical protein JW960_18255 [candidate division KSB1 bacterium]|nr:hypothetical protein [candidate division KSB1 bacterium]
MKSIIKRTIFALFCMATLARAQGKYKNTWDYYTQLEQRRQVMLAAIAGKTWMEGQDYRDRIYLGVVKLYTGIDEKAGLQYLIDAVDDSVHWWCFDVYSFMDAVLRVGDKMPPELIETAKFRLAENFKEDKGFTQNHKLLFRTARYLFGQTWPDGPNLADGMTPQQAKAEAEEWINGLIDRTVTLGMYEFDSVNYCQLYLICFTSLYDFTHDPLMRQKAWMMMNLLLADWAPEYLSGNWIGAHSREKFNQVTHTVLNSGVAMPFGYMFFGDSQFHPELPEAILAGIGAVQGFRPMPLVGNIATDRSQPYVHRETKSPRRGLGICQGEIPIWKYDYVTKNYALGSSYGDISAVENHRWDLTWVSEKDGSTCFFINPSYSAERLRYFFDVAPEGILQEITRQRPYYSDPNKWIEGSVYEELCQYKNTIIALYNIPENTRNGHVNGFFPKIIEERNEDSDGWIFCKSDSIYFAVKLLTKGTWHEEPDHFRLTLNDRRTGVIMEVAQISEYPSFEAFKQQIESNALKIDLTNLHITYTNSHSDKLNFTYGKERIINGKKVNFKAWPLFSGPFVNSKMGSKIINIQYGKEKFILDFNDFSVHREMVY